MNSRNHTELEKVFTNLVTVFEDWNYIPTIFSMLINIFHVVVLSKKSVACNAVNSVLLGIGVVDIFSPLIYLKIAVHNLMEPRNCDLPNTHLEVIIDWVFAAIRDDFRRCSVWLGLALAVIRTISLKLATKKKFNFINTSRTGSVTIFCIVLLSSIFSICFIFRYQIVQVSEPWMPGEECPGLAIPPDHIHLKIAEITTSNSFLEKYARKVHLVLTAVFGKIIPCILFPISTLLLILELRKANKLWQPANHQNIRTTRLVVHMTITYIIVELPIGICKLITATRVDFEDAIIPESISTLLNIINVSVTATHFLICFSMSSQYRKTVKNLLGSTKKIGHLIFSKVSYA